MATVSQHSPAGASLALAGRFVRGQDRQAGRALPGWAHGAGWVGSSRVLGEKLLGLRVGPTSAGPLAWPILHGSHGATCPAVWRLPKWGWRTPGQPGRGLCGAFRVRMCYQGSFSIRFRIPEILPGPDIHFIILATSFYFPILGFKSQLFRSEGKNPPVGSSKLRQGLGVQTRKVLGGPGHPCSDPVTSCSRWMASSNFQRGGGAASCSLEPRPAGQGGIRKPWANRRSPCSVLACVGTGVKHGSASCVAVSKSPTFPVPQFPVMVTNNGQGYLGDNEISQTEKAHHPKCLLSSGATGPFGSRPLAASCSPLRGEPPLPAGAGCTW